MEFRENFEPDAFYHLYNHANGHENLFETSDNYYFFLEKYQKYLSPIVKTYAYCLMPNHFHFLVQVKSIEKILDFYNSKHGENIQLSDLDNGQNVEISKVVSQELSNMLNSYTQAFNKEQNRKGGLFRSRTKRKKVDDFGYRNFLVIYLHRNPIHHCFRDDLDAWTHSSYQEFWKEKTLITLETNTVLDWFSGKQNFEKLHLENLERFLLMPMDFTE